MELGIITSASISNGSIDKKKKRTGLSGLVIEFETDETIKDGAVVKITFKGKEYAFKVREVEVNKDFKLTCKATEYGYSVGFLKSKDDLDLRDLFKIPVILITDEKLLKELREQSCWC